MSYGKAVAGLLEHERWKHGKDLQSDPVAKLVDPLEQFRFLQPKALPRGAHPSLLVFPSAAVGGERIARVVAAGFAHHNCSFLRQPVEPKGGEEGVKQARVIAVLHVLHVELPVARQCLGIASEQFDRCAHDAANA